MHNIYRTVNNEIVVGKASPFPVRMEIVNTLLERSLGECDLNS